MLRFVSKRRFLLGHWTTLESDFFESGLGGAEVSRKINQIINTGAIEHAKTFSLKDAGAFMAVSASREAYEETATKIEGMARAKHPSRIINAVNGEIRSRCFQRNIETNWIVAKPRSGTSASVSWL